MIEMVLASRNRGKLKELEALLSQTVKDVILLSLDDVGFTGEIVEDGNSFEANALIKARAAARSGKIGIGDDSGLCVRALGGAPGIFSARFAGGHGDDAANNEKLLRELEGKSDRSAAFVSAIACVIPGEGEFVTLGRAEGVILDAPRGEGGFGYDPYFWYPPLGKTFAEFTPEEKNAVSHRGNAVRAFAREIAERLKKD